MCIDDGFYREKNIGDQDEIVIIERNKFLDLWKNEPYPLEKKLIFGDENIWRSDYKFHHAENGFAQGIDNPVPLAYLHCYLTDKRQKIKGTLVERILNKNWEICQVPYCAFTNGITRTIWLLANGAEYFPVMTDRNSYELLKSCAGIMDTEQMVQCLWE